jgi:hypothetical protein
MFLDKPAPTIHIPDLYHLFFLHLGGNVDNHRIPERGLIQQLLGHNRSSIPLQPQFSEQ